MPYTIQPCTTPLAIPEAGHATAPVVRFTRFTSCIGILALSPQAQIFALHLVLHQGTAAFDADAVPIVATEMTGCRRGSVIVLGQTAYWENNVRDGYDALIRRLTADFGEPKIYALADGVYGAALDGGEIDLTYG